MSGIGLRGLAAAVVLGSAALFTGIGISLTSADEPKAPDLSDLKDAVKSAAKRGTNVEEIRRAADALDKFLAKGWAAPKPGEKANPPAELTALREAVEAAAKRGENVDAIRTELEAVEKAMTGQTLAKPMPVPPPDLPPNRPPVRPGFPGGLDFPDFPVPVLPDFPLPGGGGVDRELLQKAQELRNKAFDMMRRNPTDAEALQLMQEAQQLMLKAMLNGRGGLNFNLNPAMPFPDLGRVNDRFRLGIRMERLAPITADQLGLDGQGVAITAVVPGSPADKAGFKVHDVVVEFAGKPVSDEPGDLARRVNDAKAGEKVDVVVLRKGKRVELKGIELPEAAQANPRLPDLKPLPLPDLKLPPRPNPNPRPVPNINRLDPNQLRPLPPAADGRSTSSVSVSVENGRFTIKADENGVRYVVTGTKADDGVVVDKVAVTDGDKKPVDVGAVKDVPAEYRETVERLLKMLGGRKRD